MKNEDQHKVKSGRQPITSSLRKNFSRRSVYAEKQEGMICGFCGHHKALVGGGPLRKKTCAKCKNVWVGLKI